jgi:hypothetical protein
MKAFLSYPREQHESAQAFYRFLQSVGVETWWDRADLVTGDEWNRERWDALRAADLFVLICSQETFAKSGVIQREIREALELARDKPPGLIYILCLRVEDVEIPPELARFQWLDLFRKGWKPELARGLKKAFAQRSLPAPAPLEVALTTSISSSAEPDSVDEEDENGTRASVFLRYLEEGSYWEYVNAEILIRALGGLYEARRQQAEWTHGDGTGDWYQSITEFHRSGELVSLVVAGGSYFNRAIHPNHFVTTVNLFGPRNGRLQITELFDHSPKAFEILLDYCNLDLKRQGTLVGEAPVSLDHHADMVGWELFSHYNVNERGMIINFSAAAGLPHVLGVFEIYIPWELVKGFLIPSVRTFLSFHGLPVESERSFDGMAP